MKTSTLQQIRRTKDGVEFQLEGQVGRTVLPTDSEAGRALEAFYIAAASDLAKQQGYIISQLGGEASPSTATEEKPGLMARFGALFRSEPNQPGFFKRMIQRIANMFRRTPQVDQHLDISGPTSLAKTHPGIVRPQQPGDTDPSSDYAVRTPPVQKSSEKHTGPAFVPPAVGRASVPPSTPTTNAPSPGTGTATPVSATKTVSPTPEIYDVPVKNTAKEPKAVPPTKRGAAPADMVISEVFADAKGITINWANGVTLTYPSETPIAKMLISSYQHLKAANIPVKNVDRVAKSWDLAGKSETAKPTVNPPVVPHLPKTIKVWSLVDGKPVSESKVFAPGSVEGDKALNRAELINRSLDQARAAVVARDLTMAAEAAEASAADGDDKAKEDAGIARDAADAALRDLSAAREIANEVGKDASIEDIKEVQAIVAAIIIAERDGKKNEPSTPEPTATETGASSGPVGDEENLNRLANPIPVAGPGDDPNDTLPPSSPEIVVRTDSAPSPEKEEPKTRVMEFLHVIPNDNGVPSFRVRDEEGKEHVVRPSNDVHASILLSSLDKPDMANKITGLAVTGTGDSLHISGISDGSKNVVPLQLFVDSQPRTPDIVVGATTAPAAPAQPSAGDLPALPGPPAGSITTGARPSQTVSHASPDV